MSIKNYIDRVRNLISGSYWMSKGMYSILDRISVFSFGFIGFLFLVRILPMEEFGIWSLFVIISALIETTRTSLISNGLIWLISNHKDKESEISNASIILNLFYTAVVGILIYLLKEMSWFSSYGLLFRLLNIFIITNFILAIYSHLLYLHQYHTNFKAIFLNNLFRQGIYFLFILFSYLFLPTMDIITLAYAQLIILLIVTVLSSYFARSYLSLTWNFEMHWIKQLFAYGKYSFGTGLSSLLFRSIDHYMLGYLLSASRVALYNTAIRVTNFVDIPTLSIAAVVFPHSAESFKSKGIASVREIYEKSVAANITLILPVLLFILLFPKMIIYIVAGPKYYDSIPILRVTAFYSLIIPFLRQFGVIIDSIGKPQVNFRVIFSITCLSLVTSYFFIKYFGMIGASYSTLAVYLVAFAISQYILWKELQIKFLRILRYTVSFYRRFIIAGVQFFKKSEKKSLSGEKE